MCMPLWCLRHSKHSTTIIFMPNLILQSVPISLSPPKKCHSFVSSQTSNLYSKFIILSAMVHITHRNSLLIRVRDYCQHLRKHTYTPHTRTWIISAFFVFNFQIHQLWRYGWVPLCHPTTSKMVTTCISNVTSRQIHNGGNYIGCMT